ncbi:DNA cytosine methyltransferase [Aneurinibacillus migulanus]|uniref:Type II methyltransferase M.BbvI n=2 Tax=Paenibacillaceae TaxID=186822 RepID=MTB1_BREBE|nr:DNA cytosine methyltransferase [Aneurinibacillus migulanus]P34905.1 RecName: Full=Type II methyltransferase M.BbvI; Short=M.BbvI; AltName: Full=Cytosine-specific methyltransferase BbvI; AltName: Full=Modification methylase BbvI [Brevibacillus brevis]KIV52894.1 cytosine methyltransferase [Aneurinibacillus migulanus]KON95171.1 cytosine methyltransferase [Aneurinibacillus migulanus]MED0890906.1 DNA cytosine methyltransferase [Aneurinibacillus migulanus]MED1616598.1 DNA cytosine methyltransfera
MKFRKGELFCGPGGLALGAKEAKYMHPETGEVFEFEHAWANDIDEWACETFRTNICPDRPDSVVCGDVRELDIKSLGEKFGEIDAFTFGFPCNDYSIVGEHKGMEGNYGPLYSYGVKILNEYNPLVFIAENVGGLQSANEGKAFLGILNDLASAGKYGYKLVPHLYKFEEYGVPQRRHRIIIVGIRKDQDVAFRVPEPTHKEKYRTASEALADIPEDALNHEFTRHKKKVVEMLNHIAPGGNAWSESIPEELRLNVKKVRMSQIYRRLHPDQPSYTVTGSGGGGTHGYHWEEPRALTNRERARLQTFPDDYEFIGKKEMVRKQIGMAVPPDGAKIILEAVLKTFARIEYPSINSKWDFESVSAEQVIEEVQEIM